MSSRLTRPVEPACYGNDQTFGWFWRHNFDKLMAQAQAVEKDYNQLLIQVRALEAEVSRLERVASNG
jgi:hypothetical protein